MFPHQYDVGYFIYWTIPKATGCSKPGPREGEPVLYHLTLTIFLSIRQAQSMNTQGTHITVTMCTVSTTTNTTSNRQVWNVSSNPWSISKRTQPHKVSDLHHISFSYVQKICCFSLILLTRPPVGISINVGSWSVTTIVWQTTWELMLSSAIC